MRVVSKPTFGDLQKTAQQRRQTEGERETGGERDRGRERHAETALGMCSSVLLLLCEVAVVLSTQLI